MSQEYYDGYEEGKGDMLMAGRELLAWIIAAVLTILLWTLAAAYRDSESERKYLLREYFGCINQNASVEAMPNATANRN